MNRGITPTDVAFTFRIPYGLAKRLLFHYLNEELFTRPKRGIYRISKRGRQRLDYLQLRQEISKETGVDVGLNLHNDFKLSKPMYQLVREFQERTGWIVPAGFF
jgi:hypothetical protein